MNVQLLQQPRLGITQRCCLVYMVQMQYAQYVEVVMCCMYRSLCYYYIGASEIVRMRICLNLLL